MSTTTKDYLQNFTSLPLHEQLQLSYAINEYLNKYFTDLTLKLEQEEKNVWQFNAKENLTRAYGNDEPEYSLEDTL